MALVFCFLFILCCRKPQNTPFGLPGVMDEIWTRYLQSRNLMLPLHQWVWWYNLRKSQQQLRLSLNNVWFLCVLQSVMKKISSMLELWMCNWCCNYCTDYELFNVLLCHYTTSSGCVSAWLVQCLCLYCFQYVYSIQTTYRVNVYAIIWSTTNTSFLVVVWHFHHFPITICIYRFCVCTVFSMYIAYRQHTGLMCMPLFGPLLILHSL